jgi:hypothetical protein
VPPPPKRSPTSLLTATTSIDITYHPKGPDEKSSKSASGYSFYWYCKIRIVHAEKSHFVVAAVATSDHIAVVKRFFTCYSVSM